MIKNMKKRIIILNKGQITNETDAPYGLTLN